MLCSGEKSTLGLRTGSWHLPVSLTRSCDCHMTDSVKKMEMGGILGSKFHLSSCDSEPDRDLSEPPFLLTCISPTGPFWTHNKHHQHQVLVWGWGGTIGNLMKDGSSYVCPVKSTTWLVKLETRCIDQRPALSLCHVPSPLACLQPFFSEKS